MCRPRFFAGQLLSEQDLNLLDHYIVEKSKLHNRYLFGWGVACGLDVVCDPCGNNVLVRPGYALSGCGDDIIVCREESVDVCALINACCTPQPDDCQPPRPRPAGCDDLEQQWVLAICYRETPSRGITALKGSAEAPCCSKCGGGGSSSCGCGGGSKKRASASGCGCGSATSAKRVPPQCEPTQTCEGYYFKVFLAPTTNRDPNSTVGGVAVNTSNLGAMFQRFINCLLELYASVPSAPAATATLDQIRQWCCDVRDALLDVAAGHGTTNCRLIDALTDLCPTPAAGTTPQQYLNSVTARLAAIVRQLLIDCFCSALLPPCPGPVEDPCVPLATITVRRTPCKVVRICNLENRKFLTTLPNLQYWLSWVPYVRQLREALNRVCCRPADFSVGTITPGTQTFPGAAATNFGATNRRQSSATTSAFVGSFTSQGQPSTLDALSLDVLGVADANGHPFLSQAQLASPLASVVADEFARPLVGAAVPEGFAALFTAAGGVDAVRLAEENKRQAAELDSLRAQITQLESTVRTQQITLEGIIGRLGKG